jgi:TP901 family phage tail tape measure protein
VADRTVAVNLTARVQGLVGGLATGKQAVKDFGGELDKLSRTNKEKFSNLTTAGIAVGGALTASFGFAVKSAMDFDKQMSEVGAVSGATGKQLDQLRTAAINAGQATVFSASDAADAEAELAKAGVSTSDILGGALTGTLSLAAAGTINLADAATDAAQAMNIFGLRGGQVSHVADVLAAGANSSATDVSGLSQALNQSGLVAHQTGLSLEETVGTLSAFAQAGLTGSDAGTSFKTMLQALQAPSQQTKALMDKLGISAYNAQGNFIGITALAQQLQNQLGNLTQAQRDNALAQIFGNDAVRAANVLYEDGSGKLQQWIDGVDKTGAAADTARAKMNNLSGDVENLKGSLETLTISTGSGVQGGLRSLTQAATRAVNSISVMPASVSKAGTAVLGIGGALVLGASAFGKVKQKSDEFSQTLKDMGPLGERAAGALGKTTSAVGKLGVALAAFQAFSAAFGTDISPNVEQTAEDLVKLGQTGQATGDVLNHLSYDLSATGTGAMAKFENGVSGTVESLTGLGNVFDESLTHARERLSSIDEALAALVSAGKVEDAQNAFQQLFNIAHKQGISLSDLNAALPNYTAAWNAYSRAQQGLPPVLQDTTAAQDANAASASAMAGQQEQVANSIADTIGEANGLSDLLDRLNGKAVSMARANSDLQAAYDAMSQSIKDNGKTLDTDTEKGRANMDALLNIEEAAEKASQATLDQTGSVDKANDVLQQGREKFVKYAAAILGSREAAEKLADQLFKVPAKTTPKVDDKSVVAASNVAYGYKRILDDIDGSHIQVDYTTYFHTKGTPPSQYYHGNRWGGLYEHAADGLLSEASVYSPVSPGRYMIAEPQTGGEAFIPKYGDYGRSTGILDEASRWYGGRFVPNGMGWSGSGSGSVISLSLPPIQVTARAGNDLGSKVIEGLRLEVAWRGGDVQTVIGQ